MRIGVGEGEVASAESFQLRKGLSRLDFHAVVTGIYNVLEFADGGKTTSAGLRRAGGIARSQIQDTIRGSQYHRIDVHQGSKFVRAVTHIANLQQCAGTEFRLNIDTVLIAIRSVQVGIHDEDIAWQVSNGEHSGCRKVEIVPWILRREGIQDACGAKGIREEIWGAVDSGRRIEVKVGTRCKWFLTIKLKIVLGFQNVVENSKAAEDAPSLIAAG